MLRFAAVNKVVQAHMYRDGIGGKPRDPVEAVRLYKEAAAEGSAEAMLNAGQMMLRGQREVLDFAQGRRLLEKAAGQRDFLLPGVRNLGVAEAKHALGNLFRDGLGLAAPDITQVSEGGGT